MTLAVRVDRRPIPLAYRRRTRPVPRPIQPTALVLSYTRTLRAMSLEMNRAIVATVLAAMPKRTDAASDPGDADPEFPPALIARLERIMVRKLRDIGSRRNLVGAIDQLATRMVGFTRQEWGRQLKGVLGITLGADPDLARLVEQFRREQGELIVSLSAEKVRRVKRVLRERGADARVENIMARIQAATGATDYRAALIARTEVTTMNSKLSQARHEAAGVASFRWSTSLDERVRKSHAALEGRVFAYASPPEIPGEGRVICGQVWNCRCVALAQLPGIDDVEAVDTLRGATAAPVVSGRRGR